MVSFDHTSGDIGEHCKVTLEILQRLTRLLLYLPTPLGLKASYG